MKRYFAGMIFVLGLILVFETGYQLAGAIADPVIVTYEGTVFELSAGQTLDLIPKASETVYIELPPKIVIEERVVEVPVEKIVERIVEKEVTIKPEYFKTEGELREWVENNHGFLNVGTSLLTKHDKNNDCEDQAERWQAKALRDGHLVDLCPVYNGMVFDTKVSDGKYPYHVGLWTSIGNNYYYWEPTTGKITKLKVVRD